MTEKKLKFPPLFYFVNKEVVHIRKIQTSFVAEFPCWNEMKELELQIKFCLSLSLSIPYFHTYTLLISTYTFLYRYIYQIFQ